YPIRVIPDAHNKTIWSMDFHPVGHTLATSSVDNTVKFWARSRPTTESTSGEQEGVAFEHEKIPGIGYSMQE
ncbi:hypothetical protein NEHOM01_2093, partial [Nematocida homosporus]|uniref:uncharacterized protein n=1 Tax=Nematocida homosporus TaxID=1912981 RepID=UPI00221F7338